MDVRYVVYRKRPDGLATQVAYIMNEQFCIYMGHDCNCGSTIQNTEDVIEAICAEESQKSEDLVWFDLQTRHGYEGHKEDTFELDRVFFDSKGHAQEWHATLLPDEVRRHFGALLEGKTKHRRIKQAATFPFAA